MNIITIIISQISDKVTAAFYPLFVVAAADNTTKTNKEAHHSCRDSLLLFLSILEHISNCTFMT